MLCTFNSSSHSARSIHRCRRRHQRRRSTRPPPPPPSYLYSVHHKTRLGFLLLCHLVWFRFSSFLFTLPSFHSINLYEQISLRSIVSGLFATECQSGIEKKKKVNICVYLLHKRFGWFHLCLCMCRASERLPLSSCSFGVCFFFLFIRSFAGNFFFAIGTMCHTYINIKYTSVFEFVLLACESHLRICLNNVWLRIDFE